MKETYIEFILMIERLHRRFLDVIKTELERLRVDDINNVQTMILYNISGEQLTVTELTNRGYYLGSNVSYNVKKLVENGYLIQAPSPHDKRSTRISLSEKGSTLCKKIDELYQRHLQNLQNDPIMASLSQLNQSLHRLERFWTDYIDNAHKLK